MIVSSAKITEQCANLTMAFRANYHAYVGHQSILENNRLIFVRLELIWTKFARRHKFDCKISRMKVTIIRSYSSKHLSFIVVTNAEQTVVNSKAKFIELNAKLDREILHFNHLKQSMELIA